MSSALGEAGVPVLQLGVVEAGAEVGGVVGLEQRGFLQVLVLVEAEDLFVVEEDVLADELEQVRVVVEGLGLLRRDGEVEGHARHARRLHGAFLRGLLREVVALDDLLADHAELLHQLLDERDGLLLVLARVRVEVLADLAPVRLALEVDRHAEVRDVLEQLALLVRGKPGEPRVLVEVRVEGFLGLEVEDADFFFVFDDELDEFLEAARDGVCVGEVLVVVVWSAGRTALELCEAELFAALHVLVVRVAVAVGAHDEVDVVVPCPPDGRPLALQVVVGQEVEQVVVLEDDRGLARVLLLEVLPEAPDEGLHAVQQLHALAPRVRALADQAELPVFWREPRLLELTGTYGSSGFSSMMFSRHIFSS